MVCLHCSIFAWIFLVIPTQKFGIFAIIRGHRTPNYPYFVRLELPSKFCGGTLLAPNAVVTSASCLYYEQSNRWVAYQEVHILKSDFSKRNWPKNARRYSCERYVTHGSYNPYMNGGLQPFDVAVVKLTSCVDEKPKKSYTGIVPVSSGLPGRIRTWYGFEPEKS